jgi:hypothetical protein
MYVNSRPRLTVDKRDDSKSRRDDPHWAPHRQDCSSHRGIMGSRGTTVYRKNRMRPPRGLHAVSAVSTMTHANRSSFKFEQLWN